MAELGNGIWGADDFADSSAIKAEFFSFRLPSHAPSFKIAAIGGKSGASSGLIS
jgi:hypothetical protein